MIPKCIRLESGELLEAGEEKIDGVMTDAGLIPWAWILGWMIWDAKRGRYFSVPIN